MSTFFFFINLLQDMDIKAFLANWRRVFESSSVWRRRNSNANISKRLRHSDEGCSEQEEGGGGKLVRKREREKSSDGRKTFDIAENNI